MQTLPRGPEGLNFNNMCRTLTAREFIQETLIKEFGDIVNGKERHDYISFLLISCGIEFLGRCMDAAGTDWELHKSNGKYFKQGITLFPQCYQKRKKRNIPHILYKGLRCGICHALLPQKNIYVSSKKKQDLNNIPICLNIRTFFDDFKKACTSLLNNEKYNARLEEKFISISDGSTGNTISLKAENE